MIIYVILFIIVITLLILSLIGFIVKPTNIPINVNPGTGINNKKCTSQVVECSTDNDCSSNCVESSQGEEMKCIEIKVNNKNYGNTKKVCALAKAEMKCNTQYGGLPVWSGWTNPDRMEWDCLCMYPNYAGGESCSKLNPNVCNGGQGFQWNANDGPPENGICSCVDGQEKIIDKNGVPICVEKGKGLWYKDSKPNHVANMCNEDHCKAPNCILTKDTQDPNLNKCACLGNDDNNFNTGWQDGVDQMCVECKPDRGPPGDCSKKLFTDKPITIYMGCYWRLDHESTLDGHCKEIFGNNSTYINGVTKCDTDNCSGSGVDQDRYGCNVPTYYANIDFDPTSWSTIACNNPGNIIGPDNALVPPGFVKVD